MEVRTMKLTKLKPSPHNPRTELRPGMPEYESLSRSIDEFGMVEPLVWNKQSGCLVGGHQRKKILEERGETEADVVVVDLDDNQEKLLCLALNKTGGKWDRDRLRDMMVELQKQNADLSASGFTEFQIAQLIETAAKKAQVPTYDLGVAPLEHYDFIMVVFDDPRDWLAALNKLGVHQVQCEKRHELVGLGRVIKGADLLEKLQ